MNEVLRFLVTGSDHDLEEFELSLCVMCNFIERRGQTLFFTAWETDRGAIINVARRVNVTLQEIEIEGLLEVYPVLHEGTMPGWKKPERTQ